MSVLHKVTMCTDICNAADISFGVYPVYLYIFKREVLKITFSRNRPDDVSSSDILLNIPCLVLEPDVFQ